MDTTQPRPMTRRRLGQTVLAVALSAALFGSVGPVLATTDDAVTVRQTADAQTNVGGGVTVKVSQLDVADAIGFKVVLDTHSVNLDAYDLGQLAVLRTRSGEEIAPLAWEAPAGGHHREGTLSFPAVTADGTPVVQPDGGQLVLVIRDIAGVPERSFAWPA
jgi:hypothetical protein